MISRIKFDYIALTAAGIILLILLFVFFFNSDSSADDPKPIELGSPAKMAIYDEAGSLPLDPDTEEFAKVWAAAEVAILSGNFDNQALTDNNIKDLAAYAAANSTTMLEIFFDEPFELAASKQAVHRLLIDVNNEELFTAEVKDGGYSSGAFPLAKIKALRATLDNIFPSVGLNLVVKAEPEEGGQVFGSGIYRYGEKITVKAIVTQGYLFAGWKDGDYFTYWHERFPFTVSSADHPEESTLSGDITLIAVFEEVDGAHFKKGLSFIHDSFIIPRLSPGQDYLLGIRDNSFLFYSFPDGSLVDTSRVGEQYQIKEFKWHPQNNSLAYFVESEQQVHLYLMNLAGEKKKIMSFDQAKYEPSTFSLEGINNQIGWFAWARQGEAIALEIQSEEATTLYLVDLDGTIIHEKILAEPHYCLRSPLASNNGRKIAFTLFGQKQEDLWLWELDNNNLRQVTGDGEGDYPFQWVDHNTLLVKMGAVSTGGGAVYALAAIDLEDGSRSMVDHQTHRLNQVNSISPGGSHLLGGSYTQEGDNRIYVLDLENNHREVLWEDQGLMIRQAQWLNETEALIITSDFCPDEYLVRYNIQHFAQGKELITLKQSLNNLHLLDNRDGILHYLEANETGNHWIWKTLALE